MESLIDRIKEHRGLLAGVFCYILWGLFPLYWKLLDDVNAFEVIAHRIIWCTVFTVLVCVLLRLDFIALLRSSRARRFLIPASIIITANWSLYVFAVSIDMIVETAIGYYLNPRITIVLGMLVFKERLAPMQVIAIILCTIGLIFFTTNYGQFPWIAILLALTFGVYGAIKKKGGYPAVEAIAFENIVAFLPAIAFTIFLAYYTGDHGFLGDISSWQGWQTTLLLIGGGVVTAIPLILYAAAANLIPLTILGFLQYISPTIALLIGVFLNNEPFTLAHGICFGCIWTGLILVAINSFLQSRKHQKVVRS